MSVLEPITVQPDHKLAFQKANRRIAVVASDTSGMKETAFGSIETSRSVCDALKTRYHRVDFYEAATEVDLRRVVESNPDLVVICAKYIIEKEQSKKIWLSDYFSLYGIPFTGSDRATLKFDSDKSKAKTVLQNNNIATARFFLTRPDQVQMEHELPLRFPVFIKPLDAANGNGVDENSLAHDFAGYQAKVLDVCTTYDVPALVEEVLPGREFTVAILDGADGGARLVMPVEIVVPENKNGDRILGCREKSGNQERLQAVAEPAFSAVSSLAVDAFTVLGARDFGRIDIKMDAKGVPHFMEANLVPGMTPETSYFPRACAINCGMTYSEVVARIAEAALSRADLVTAH